MKIAVYAISKNEEAVAKRWTECSKEADYRIVTDTGSTDKTIKILEENGVKVYKTKIEPWRFDTARNKSLKNIPKNVDVCIALDMDEILLPGWRQALEKAWKPSTTLLRYPFIAKLKENSDTPEKLMNGHRIHARHAYYWKYAVHEILRPFDFHEECYTDELTIQHLPKKEKKLGHYLPALKKIANEEANEPRYLYFIGCEYFDIGDYKEAFNYLEKFLGSPNSCDSSQRSFALRILARSAEQLNLGIDIVIGFLYRSATGSPGEREPWVFLAEKMGEIGNWPNCLSASVNALRINDRSRSFIIEEKAWDETIEKLFKRSCNELGISIQNADKLNKKALNSSKYNKHKTSIIILAYKEPKKFIKMFETLLKNTSQEDTPFEIIVVSNNAEIQIQEYLRLKKNVIDTLIFLPENIGVTKGYNLGVANSKGHYLCFFNSDYYMMEGWLYSMINCFEHQKNIGLISCCTNVTANSHERINAELLENGEVSANLPGDYAESDYPIAQMFTTKKIFDEVNGFDEYYFVSMLDLDFGEGIRRKGYKLFVNRKCFGYHDYDARKVSELINIDRKNKEYFNKKWN